MNANHRLAASSAFLYLLLIVLPANALPPATDRPPADLADQAHWMSELGDPEGALATYEWILRDYRDFVDIRSIKARLVQSYLRAKRYNDALALAESIIAEYPGTGAAAWATFFKAQAYRRTGDVQTASKLYAQVAKDFQSGDIWPMLVACSEQAELFAIMAGKKLSGEIPPTSPSPKSTPEREAAAKAIYEDALKVLYAQIPLDQDPVGKNQQALQNLRGLVSGYSDTSYVPGAMRAIVHAHLNLRQNEEAIVAARQVIERFPGTVAAGWSQVFVGEAYRNMHQWQNAYHAFLDTEAYGSLSDAGPVQMARKKAREMWGELCKANPEMKNATWPLQGRNLSIGDLAVLNGFDRSDSESCAWVGVCWMTTVPNHLVLDLYAEMANSYPDQRLYLALAALSAGQRFLEWAKHVPDTPEWQPKKASAVALLQSVKTRVPELPAMQAYADLILVRYYSQKEMWPQVITAGEHGVNTQPGAPFQDELAARLANAYIQTERYGDALANLALVAKKPTYSGWIWPAMHATAGVLARQGNYLGASQRMLELAGISNSSDWRIYAACEAARYRDRAGDKAGTATALRIAASEIRQDLAAGTLHLKDDWPAYALGLLAKIDSRIAELESK